MGKFTSLVEPVKLFKEGENKVLHAIRSGEEEGQTVSSPQKLSLTPPNVSQTHFIFHPSTHTRNNTPFFFF